MATDQYLLDRIRKIMSGERKLWTEKKMFGGDCFMVDNKMCFGASNSGLMVRISPNEEESLLELKGSEPMQHGGRPMNGYLFVQPEGYDNDDDLKFWIQKCLEFNPKAKASKRRK